MQANNLLLCLAVLLFAMAEAAPGEIFYHARIFVEGSE
jgi:hypothetical protein